MALENTPRLLHHSWILNKLNNSFVNVWDIAGRFHKGVQGSTPQGVLWEFWAFFRESFGDRDFKDASNDLFFVCITSHIFRVRKSWSSSICMCKYIVQGVQDGLEINGFLHYNFDEKKLICTLQPFFHEWKNTQIPLENQAFKSV